MKAPIENVDFGKTAKDYLTHRAGFPDSLFLRIHDMGYGIHDETVADIGTGTGTLGRGFALRGCDVTGIDPSAEMLKAAEVIDQSLNLTTRYIIGSGETTTLPGDTYDLVTAGQCWHWFDAPKACAEIRRILKPGGRLIVAYYDWLPLKGNVVRRTEKLIEKHNPKWLGGNGTGIHPALFRDLGEHGFSDIESFTYEEPAVYTHESWRGRIRASAGIAATLSAEAVEQFDLELAELLKEEFPDEPLSVPHRVFVVIASH